MPVESWSQNFKTYIGFVLFLTSLLLKDDFVGQMTTVLENKTIQNDSSTKISTLRRHILVYRSSLKSAQQFITDNVRLKKLKTNRDPWNANQFLYTTVPVLKSNCHWCFSIDTSFTYLFKNPNTSNPPIWPLLPIFCASLQRLQQKRHDLIGWLKHAKPSSFWFRIFGQADQF